MERVTTRIAGAAALSPVYEEQFTSEELIDFLLGRLAEYEDTGYSPVSFDHLCREMSDIRTACGIMTYDQLRRMMSAAKAGRLKVLPCKEGDTVYRICPKCNDKHDGSCDNCAWQPAIFNHGCSVYGLWSDGQYPADQCTIVPYKVSWNYFPNMLEVFGKKVFLHREEAERALKAKEKKA